MGTPQTSGWFPHRYASLFAFHAYLAVLGMGTYDWILAQRAEPPKPATELVAKGARVAQEEDAA